MIAPYVVTVAFIDSSYWDDGSRWTRQNFKFKTRKEAFAFAREATTKGCRLKGRNDELHIRPEPRDVTMTRTSQVNWQGPTTEPGGTEKP